MTSPTASGAGAATLDGPQGFSVRRSRWLAPAIVVGVLLAVSFAVTALTSNDAGNTDDLDPANPASSGARGVANVLRDHGVGVSVVRGQRALLAATVDGATTVAITATLHLSARTARVALAHAGSAAAVVVFDPDPEVIDGMGLPVTSHLADLTDVAAGCPGTILGAGFRLAQADRAYLPTGGSGGSGDSVTTCFHDKRDGGGAMVSLPAAAGGPPVILLGDPSLISNGTILDADNAAIALRLLGQTSRLVWYVPSAADITASDPNTRSVAPAWFQPGVALTASAVVFLCLWRGRRLGPLVGEPLPVIVRAIETTQSRGRMYRKARDRTRAVAVLQLATRRRLTAYLGLPTSSPVTSVAGAAAAVSGRGYRDVLGLLSSPEAPDDTSLLDLANTLAALEKEVRRP